MRAASASIHAVIFSTSLALGMGAVACGAAPQGPVIGVSDATPERSSPVEPAPPRAPWSDFAAARAWPEAAPRFTALAHFRDGTLVHVRVQPAGLEAYQKLAVERPMPGDARVVAWHESKAGQLLGGYLLEKVAGVWAPREIDAGGSLVPSDGAACLRCHAMAPTDHLFGAPRQSPAVPAAESSDPTPR